LYSSVCIRPTFRRAAPQEHAMRASAAARVAKLAAAALDAALNAARAGTGPAGLAAALAARNLTSPLVLGPEPEPSAAAAAAAARPAAGRSAAARPPPGRQVGSWVRWDRASAILEEHYPFLKATRPVGGPAGGKPTGGKPAGGKSAGGKPAGGE
jgi:hypothetical protein